MTGLVLLDVSIAVLFVVLIFSIVASATTEFDMLGVPMGWNGWPPRLQPSKLGPAGLRRHPRRAVLVRPAEDVRAGPRGGDRPCGRPNLRRHQRGDR